MNETLTCSIVDAFGSSFHRIMSENWNSGDWYPTHPSNYPQFFLNSQPQSDSHPTTTTPSSASYTSPNIIDSTYQDDYGPLYGIHQTAQLPPQRGDQMFAMQYHAGQPQQSSQHSQPLFDSSPRFRPPSGARISTDRLQVSTISAFLPSQNSHMKPASTSAFIQPSRSSNKRRLPDADSEESGRSPQRRQTTIQALPSAPTSAEEPTHVLDLSEEERLLVQLKQDQGLPWKEIARAFEDKFGKPFQVPALQMRYKRLRERLRIWTDQDTAALEAAHEYWTNNKFEIIASKMADFGVPERWPARYCERQWTTLHPSGFSTNIAGSALLDHSVGARFDPDLRNHSVEWSIPSPTREATTNQADSSRQRPAATESMTSSVSSFVQHDLVG